LALYRQLGDQWGEALILGNNAAIREAEGNYMEACILARQSMRVSCGLNDKRSLSQGLDMLAGLISLEGEHEQAARLMGAAQALRDSIFAVIEPLNRSTYERWMAQVRANLDEATFTAAWAEGRLMTLEQAIEYALLG
jgi:hypothetical protein